MTLLNIAVVGVGVMGRAHISVISHNSRCRLCAIADPSKVAQVLSQEQGVTWFATLDELLDYIGFSWLLDLGSNQGPTD